MDTNKPNIDFDVFLRIFERNKKQSHAFLLGAGCSISSDIPSASSCIWDWKKILYLSNNTNVNPKYLNANTENAQREIQRWCDQQVDYPPLNDPSEYSFYVEKAYPFEVDRRAYFEGLFANKRPNIGYQLLIFLYKTQTVKSVWTTNFDNLTTIAATNQHVDAYPVTIENKEDIYNELIRTGGLIYVALHGDYKFSKLKNTEKELYKQESVFVKAMTQHLSEKHLIVMGYSGRDKSLMNALEKVYSERGAGRLFWLGIDEKPNGSVLNLIEKARQSGREAYYVQSPGFDEAMLRMALLSFRGDDKFGNELLSLLQNTNTPINNTSTPFKVNKNGCIIKYAATNVFPVTPPKYCYTFRINTPNGVKEWDFVRTRIKGQHIIAKTFGGKIYALASQDIIYKLFGKFIVDDPQLLQITPDVYKTIPVIKPLLRKALIFSLSKKTELCSNLDRNIIWDSKLSYSNTAGVYEGIHIKLGNSMTSYLLLAISPIAYVDDESTLSKIDKQNVCKHYSDSLNKSNYHNKIEFWKSRIFKGVHSSFSFSTSNEEPKFTISNVNAYCDVYGDGTSAVKDKSFNDKREIFSGIKIREPQLSFSSKNRTYCTDINPMKGLQEYLPFDLPTFAITPPSINVRVICPVSFTEKLYIFLSKLISGGIKPRYNDYTPEYKGFYNAYKVNLNIPSAGDKSRWICCRDSQSDAFLLVQNICKTIDTLNEDCSNDVIIIFIPTIWSNLHTFTRNGINYDFHDYIKAHCAKNRITTQIIEEKTLNSNMLCEIYWWLSLALFVKSGRVPWSLNSLNTNTAYAGIGYSISHNCSAKEKITLGCSHLYDAQGQGLKFRLKKIDNPQFDRRNNPYLSQEEAFRLGLTIVELYRDSMSFSPSRVVIHKRTMFTQDEISGLSKALLPHLTELDLITIEEEHDFKLYRMGLSQPPIPETYPIQRGVCVPISDNQALIWTHGSVPSVIANREYYPGAKGIPLPIRLTRCYGNTSLEEIANEILSFTKINWNSFNYYSKMPATIETSNVVARIGSLLHHYNGNTFDYKYFI